MLTDFLIISWAVIGVHIAHQSGYFTIDEETGWDMTLPQLAIAVDVVVVWLIVLKLHGAYEPRILARGAEEYRRVATASLRVIIGFALVSFLTRVDLARSYVLIALPSGLAALLLSRLLWSRWIVRQRLSGKLCERVLIVGGPEELRDILRALRQAPTTGYSVAGACTTAPEAQGVSVIGLPQDAARVAAGTDIDVVIASPSAGFGQRAVRELSWALEGTGVELIILPGLSDIASPRIMTRQLDGLPLLHVAEPEFSGRKLVVKRLFDIVGSLTLLLVALPLFLVISAWIVIDDGAPVFYRQQRIGKDGKPFMMFKFRTMARDADKRLAEVLAAQGKEVQPLYKLQDDPRVTKAGRFLRRTSLDEIPQLLNILLGQMSLVGPRPQIQAEVDAYDPSHHRRHLLKPGLTGLWQVRGRSSVTWEEAVRFDLYYVENWSVVSDISIMLQTITAVLDQRGAY